MKRFRFRKSGSGYSVRAGRKFERWRGMRILETVMLVRDRGRSARHDHRRCSALKREETAPSERSRSHVEKLRDGGDELRGGEGLGEQNALGHSQPRPFVGGRAGHVDDGETPDPAPEQDARGPSRSSCLSSSRPRPVPEIRRGRFSERSPLLPPTTGSAAGSRLRSEPPPAFPEAGSRPRPPGW